jgi:hypothetical protein
MNLSVPQLQALVQAATLRLELKQITGRQGQAQLLLRIGVPTQDVPAAPRHPLADVRVAP